MYMDVVTLQYCLEIHNGTFEWYSEAHWRLGPVAAVGSHMESKVSNIGGDSNDGNERVYRVVCYTRKCKYGEK